MKIAIGPVTSDNGGVNQQVLNIIKFSRYDFQRVIGPSSFSIYYRPHSTRYIRALRNFKIERFDFYGLYLSYIALPKFGVVHLHDYPYWPEIYLRPPKRKAKYIHTVHNVYQKEEYSNLKKDWPSVQYQNERMFRSCKNSNVVISVSKFVQELLVEQNIDSIVIPNGVDIEECDRANPSRFRNKFKVYNDFFLYIGYLQHVKRPELLVNLAKKIPEILFIIMGIEQADLEKYLNESIPNNTKCIGVLKHKDAIDAFSACKAFILPSKPEAFGISLLEAMACKKPVVATNYGGPREIISHNTDGFLFEPDNIDDLYEKVLKAWEHPELGEKGYKKVKEQFEWKVVIKKIDRLYESIV